MVILNLHSFIQQIFKEHLLGARHSSDYQNSAVNKRDEAVGEGDVDRGVWRGPHEGSHMDVRNCLPRPPSSPENHGT